MDPRRLIDQITLDLLVRKTINRDLLLPLIGLLKRSVDTKEASRLANDLEHLVQLADSADQNANDHCLVLLEALSDRIKQSAG